jgi:hypothetical protein
MEFFWTTVAAAATLAIFSFLYKDNPFYKFAEHLFVGIASGYVVVMEYYQVFRPNLWDPLTAGRDFWLLIPFALGLLMFTRFMPKIAWMSRWSMAVIIGTYAGLAVIGFTEGDLLNQVRASMVPLISVSAWNDLTTHPGLFTFLDFLSNPMMVIGLICILIYFFFSKEHTGTYGSLAKIGTGLLMIGFGAGYGYTVMTRMALLFDRLFYICFDWLHVI